MTATGALRRPEKRSWPPTQRTTPALVGSVWALLVVNSLGSGGTGTIIPIPTSLAQMITMGALAVAFALALLLNPRLRFRPSAFLLLLTLLLVVSTVASAYLQSGVGALIRSARLGVFVATLWLLTPWWGPTLDLVRYYLRTLGVVLLSVLIGLVIAPGLALPATYDGRLVGAIWYIPATQVGDYAAVVLGLLLVLWLARGVSGWSVAVIAGPALLALLLSHTRTATTALVAAVTVAGLTLTLAHARARRVVPAAVLGAGLAGLALAGPLMDWFRRGQDPEAFSNLTGREKVWQALLAQPRTLQEQLFGVGLTDKSFGGLPIDSTWLAIYHDQGILGAVIAAGIFVVLIASAATRPPSPARACALFLIVYCLIASYTQTGIGDVSAYTLHVALAAALLAPTAPQGRESHHPGPPMDTDGEPGPTRRHPLPHGP